MSPERRAAALMAVELLAVAAGVVLGPEEIAGPRGSDAELSIALAAGVLYVGAALEGPGAGCATLAMVLACARAELSPAERAKYDAQMATLPDAPTLRRMLDPGKPS